MKKELTNLIACLDLLEGCINFDHIQDREYICENLIRVEEMKEYISEEAYLMIKKFIEEEINPILDDENYFDFTTKPEFGSYDESGCFVVNSEKAFCEMVLLMYVHTFKLKASLIKRFVKFM